MATLRTSFRWAIRLDTTRICFSIDVPGFGTGQSNVTFRWEVK